MRGQQKHISTLGRYFRDTYLAVPAQVAGVPMKAGTYRVALAGCGFDMSIAAETFLPRMQRQPQ